MTFADWINSPYNTANFESNDGYVACNYYLNNGTYDHSENLCHSDFYSVRTEDIVGLDRYGNPSSGYTIVTSI
jgi:hypothetical protein